MGRPLPPIEKRATHLGYAMSNGGLAAHSMQFAAVVSVVARRDTGYEARAIRQYAVRMEWQRILDRRSLLATRRASSPSVEVMRAARRPSCWSAYRPLIVC